MNSPSTEECQKYLRMTTTEDYKKRMVTKYKKLRAEAESDPVNPAFSLKTWRKSQKLTQIEFSKMVGVSQAFVANVENNKKSMPPHWMKVIKKYNQ